MKKLVLVTSPPACGKTFISKKLAKALTNCVYLDKDTLIVLSKQICKVAGQEYNRSSEFFQREIRDYEYYAVLDLAFDALEYNDTVELAVIWIHTDIEVAHQRMISRNSDRDVWKLEHWDEYVATQNFEKPGNIPELYVFNNNSDEDFKASIAGAVKFIRG